MTRLLVALAVAATGAGLVHVFRNRLLGQLVPRLVAELRRRFGDAADVHAATLDERWQLVLEGVRIPLPRGFLLEIETMTVAGILGLSLSGLSALRVREARGIVALVGDELPLASLALPFVYRQDPGETGHAVQGQVEVREGAWAHRRDDRTGTPYLNIDLHVLAGIEGWTITHGRVLVGPAVVELEGHGPPTGAWNARARFSGVTAPLFEHLLALADPTAEWQIPAEIAVAGLLERVAGGPVQLHADVSTPHSSLSADAYVSAEGDLSGKVTGKLEIAEALELGGFADGVRPLPVGEVMLDGALGGTLAEPILAGTAFVAAIELSAGSPSQYPVYRFFDVSAPFRLTSDELVISGLTANAVSGRLTISSTVEFGIWPVQHASEIAWEGVRIEQIPTGPQGEHALNALLRASLSGKARVVGQGGDLDLLTAEGGVTLLDPDFLFLRKAESALTGFGLPTPPTRGTSPCHARIVLSGGALSVEEIRGTLEGLAFSGKVTSRFDATLSGRLLITLLPEYLILSRSFGAGAGLGPVDVPMTISGTLTEPSVQIDIAGAIGGLLRGKGMSNVVGAIGNIFQAQRQPEPRSELPPAGPEMDGILERILAGGEEAERLLESLAATGISAEEVRELLADYRRRRDN